MSFMPYQPPALPRLPQPKTGLRVGPKQAKQAKRDALLQQMKGPMKGAGC